MTVSVTFFFIDIYCQYNNKDKAAGSRKGRCNIMANRINLNGTSYHGAGAIAEIANEAKARAFKKAFVCSDPDLIKFNVTSKVTDILEKDGLAYEIYSRYQSKPDHSECTEWCSSISKNPVQIISLLSAVVLLWILQKQSVSSLPIRNLKM